MAHANEDSVAAEWVVFRNATAGGRSIEAVALADRIIAESGDPRRVAQAMIEKLVALLNMGETRRLNPLMDEIYAALRATPDPRLVGEFHAIAGAVAFENGSLGTALLNAAHAERALRRMTEVNLAAVDAWHDLSIAYSTFGFHANAMAAQREAARLCAAAGLSPAYGALIEAQVRAAVGLDQRGDNDGCMRHLRAVIASARPLLGELDLAELVFLRYAVHRLAALGEPSTLVVPVKPSADQFLADVNRLTEVCAALVLPDPALALALLDGAPRAIDVLGTAEPLRLRSLALTGLADHAGALATERSASAVVLAEDRQLRELLAGSINARLDQDRLRRVAVQYAGEAATDPLTGLPNRRRTAEVTDGLLQLGAPAMFGVLDLDGFKAVNDTHGHPAGDLVLQRIAGIFARTVRQGDLLARHGGDEFVVILPGTSEPDALEIGDRISAAVDSEDWSALVPGTPVSVSIGWAALAGDTDTTLRLADEALYRIKRARH